VIIERGYHRSKSPGEIQKIVCLDLASRLRIVNHDGEDEANLNIRWKFGGTSSEGVRRLIFHRITLFKINPLSAWSLRFRQSLDTLFICQLMQIVISHAVSTRTGVSKS